MMRITPRGPCTRNVLPPDHIAEILLMRASIDSVTRDSEAHLGRLRRKVFTPCFKRPARQDLANLQVNGHHENPLGGWKLSLRHRMAPLVVVENLISR